MATGLENLKIYQMARKLEMKIHNLTLNFPKDEKYRSVDQLKRSSSSVTSNLAESYWKKSVKEKVHILRDMVISEGEETRSNILRCAEKGFLETSTAENISEDYIQLRKGVHGYIRFIKGKFGTNY